jgi:hypothetical protein
VAIQTLRKKTRGAKYSKTVWMGLALATAGFLEAQFRMIEHLVPEQYRGPALMLVGLVVVWLRFVTTLPVEALAPEHDDPHPEPAPDNDPP